MNNMPPGMVPVVAEKTVSAFDFLGGNVPVSNTPPAMKQEEKKEEPASISAFDFMASMSSTPAPTETLKDLTTPAPLIATQQEPEK